MNLDGSAVLHGDPEKVWSVITDPAVLARTIPGCESLEQVGEDSYRMNVSVGVGAIRGTYAGEVHLTDQKRPVSYVMHASGAGAPGQVRATVTIDLE
ncbi:MAG: SRPBCC domain-containing protein, partial [Actinomycetes bacterium]